MSQKNLSRPSQFTRKKIQNYSYGLNDQIGKGYSSQVYRGRNDQTGISVAIKVIDLKKLKSEINQILLASEIKILKGMKQYPNILTLHEVYTTKNNTYIITELCQTDLSKRIKKKLTEAEACGYMKQLQNGYSYIHKAEVIHRDMKPANLLLALDDTLKVADFGFGVSAEEVLKPSKYNVGSPLYMAPESLKRNQYSYQSDIWGIGIIFYEMLTTETPWKAKDEKSLIKKIEGQGIQSILSKKDFSPSVKQFLSKTLVIDKHQRMTPEQLIKFNLVEEQTIPCILSQKKLNLTFKYETLTSQMNTPQRQKDQKIVLHSQKSQKRILNPLKTLNLQKTGSLCQNLKRTQSQQETRNCSGFGKDNVNPEVAALKKQDKKYVSKILIAQVHFCRFLYKLLMRIKESTETGILYSVEQSSEIRNIFSSYTRLIKFKLQRIVKFPVQNFMKMKEESHLQYQETSDFRKLLKISKQYTERYSKELSEFWRDELPIDSVQSYWGMVDGKPTNCLMAVLKQRLESVVGGPSPFDTTPYTHKRNLSHYLHEDGQPAKNNYAVVETHSKDIVILDYLMTARQLLDILRDSPNDQEKFARKSRIEEIVQGITATIDYPLYGKIIERATAILDADYTQGFNRPRCSTSVSLGINASQAENRCR